MEGIPRLPMTCPGINSPIGGLPDGFEEQVKEYILLNYQDTPEKYEKAFVELDKMRQAMTTENPTPELLLVMKRYYSQLQIIKQKFPMEQGDPIKVTFGWIENDRGMVNHLAYEDINFELCFVMYNIAALHADIAANEPRLELDSIKSAFMHFQCAAWPIQQLKDKLPCRNFSNSSFQPTLLNFKYKILMSQAQECILQKSMIDHRKPIVIAKIAKFLKDSYKELIDLLNEAEMRELLSSDNLKKRLSVCTFKEGLYDSLTHYYLSQHAEEDKKMGLRLAYFTTALERCEKIFNMTAKEMPLEFTNAINFVYDVIFQGHANAKKENEFIYYERVPKPAEYEPIEGVQLVKAIGWNTADPSISGVDLFKELLPTDVIKVLSMFSEEKLKLKRDVYEKVEQKDMELETYLLSLNLNQIHLDEPISHARLPDELLKCSATFSAEPDAFPNLLHKFEEIMNMSTEAEQKLSSIILRMNNLKMANSELGKDKGFNAILGKAEELMCHHVKAKENNAELQKAVAAHSENLKLLSMPLNELGNFIFGKIVDPLDYDEGKQLRKMLDKVDEMRQQRCFLIKTFESELDGDDITQKALNERDLDPKELFETELKKHSKTIDLIQQNLSAQEKILKVLTESNASFAELRRQILEMNEKRSLQTLTLVTAFQIFQDVVKKADKAIEFYSQLFAIVSPLTTGIQHIENSEKEKQKDLEKLKTPKINNDFNENLNFYNENLNQYSRNSSISDLAPVLSPQQQQQNDRILGDRPRLRDFLSRTKGNSNQKQQINPAAAPLSTTLNNNNNKNNNNNRNSNMEYLNNSNFTPISSTNFVPSMNCLPQQQQQNFGQNEGNASNGYQNLPTSNSSNFQNQRISSRNPEISSPFSQNSPQFFQQQISPPKSALASVSQDSGNFNSTFSSGIGGYPENIPQFSSRNLPLDLSNSHQSSGNLTQLSGSIKNSATNLQSFDDLLSSTTNLPTQQQFNGNLENFHSAGNLQQQQQNPQFYGNFQHQQSCEGIVLGSQFYSSINRSPLPTTNSPYMSNSPQMNMATSQQQYDLENSSNPSQMNMANLKQIPQSNMATSQQLPSNMANPQQLPSNMATSQQLPSNMANPQQLASNMATSQQLPSNMATSQQLPPNMATSQQLPSNMATSQHLPSNIATSQQIPSNMGNPQQFASNMATSQQLPSNMANTINMTQRPLQMNTSNQSNMANQHKIPSLMSNPSQQMPLNMAEKPSNPPQMNMSNSSKMTNSNQYSNFGAIPSPQQQNVALNDFSTSTTSKFNTMANPSLISSKYGNNLANNMQMPFVNTVVSTTSQLSPNPQQQMPINPPSNKTGDIFGNNFTDLLNMTNLMNPSSNPPNNNNFSSTATTTIMPNFSSSNSKPMMSPLPISLTTSTNNSDWRKNSPWHQNCGGGGAATANRQ